MNKTKICIKCKKRKSIDKFSKNVNRCRRCVCDNTNVHYKINKNAYHKRNKNQRDLKQKQYIEYKKTLCCENCGEDRYYCLDFHHKDPKQKEFGIGESALTSSFNKIKKEILKCVVLCKNCHAEVHFKMKQKI